MTDNTAPAEIAMDWEPGKAITSGPLFADSKITHWVRKDISDAAVAAAKREAFNEGVQALLQEVEGFLPEFGAGDPQDGTDLIIDQTWRQFRKIGIALLKEDTDNEK